MNKTDLSFFNTSQYKLILCLATAVFFYLFLIFFLPFGVSNYDPRHEYTAAFLSEIAIFPIVMFPLMLLNEYVLRPGIFRGLSIQRIILWSIWTCVLLSIADFFTYNILGNWHDFHLSSAIEFIVNCSSVLVFPLAGTFFFFRFRSLQAEINNALTNIDNKIDPDQMINFSGQGANDSIILSVSDFLYAQAQDNYVELHYLINGKLNKFLLRSSMRSLLASISNQNIVRCHRSFMVNLYHVKSIKGGSADLKLYIDRVETPIPVSKSYQEDIMDQLKQVKLFD